MPASWYETKWNPFYFSRYADGIGIHRLLLPVLLGLLVISLLALRRQKPVGYLVSIYIFAAYTWVFLSETVFPFPMHIHVDGFPYGSVHLIPALLEGSDPEFRLGNKQVWGNLLAGVPFGFGLPFVTSKENSTPRRIAGFGLAWAVMPELIQLLQNWLFDHFSGRAVDIDDVWLCFVGTLFGYTTLKLLARCYVRLGFSRGAHLPVWNHFHGVLMRVGASDSAQNSNAVDTPRQVN